MLTLSHNRLFTYPNPNPPKTLLFVPLFCFVFFFFSFFPLFELCRTSSRWWSRAPTSMRLALYQGGMEEQQRVSSPPAQSKVESNFPLCLSHSCVTSSFCLLCHFFFPLALCSVSDVEIFLWVKFSRVWLFKPPISLSMRSCCSLLVVSLCWFITSLGLLPPWASLLRRHGFICTHEACSEWWSTLRRRLKTFECTKMF